MITMQRLLRIFPVVFLVVGIFLVGGDALAQAQEGAQKAESQKSDVTERRDDGDGWYTVERTVVDGDSITITQRQYDDREYIAHEVVFTRSAGGADEMRIVRYGAQGKPLAITDLATDDGKFVELVNEQHGARRHVSFGENPVVWHVRRREVQYDLRADGERIVIAQDGAVASTILPLQVDDATGVLRALQGDAWVDIAVLPREISAKSHAALQAEEGVRITLTESDGAVVYSASVERTVRLFGFFPLKVQRFVTYGTDGVQRSVSAPTPWIDRLSF